MTSLPEKIFYLDARVAERAFEGLAVNFVMEGENDSSAVGVLHFDMAALAMNFHEAQSLQCL
jgi:hypothetical protein